MKTITFIRHAKSSWEYNVPDRERPLNIRGNKDAELVSNYIKDKLGAMDYIFCSPANRTLSTYDIFNYYCNWNSIPFKTSEQLYDFSGESIINFINSLPNELNNVTIFSHNNALFNIINKLGNNNIDKFPTCSLVKIQFEINEWANLKQGNLLIHLTPKHLKKLQ